MGRSLKDHVTDIKTFHNSVLCSNQTMVSYNIVDNSFDGKIAYHNTYEHFYIKLK